MRGEFLAGRGIGYLDDGTKIIARASVCATGVEYRRLNLPNEDRLLGAGVYYGAAASEASLCSNEHVVLVGAGNSSAQASLHLARYAAKVTIVMRGDCLKASVSDYLVHRIQTTLKLAHTRSVAMSASRQDLPNSLFGAIFFPVCRKKFPVSIAGNSFREATFLKGFV